MSDDTIAVGVHREAGIDAVLLITGRLTTRLSPGVARTVATQLTMSAGLIDKSHGARAKPKSSMNRDWLQPRLVQLIAGLRKHQVEEAVQLLLDYIDQLEPDRLSHLSGAAL